MDDALQHLRFPIGQFKKPAAHTPALQNEWLSAIDALPGWLDVCIENLDAAQLDTPYREGGWTVAQVIHHLGDSHMNAFIRLKLALTEQDPIVRPYNETEWAKTPEYNSVPVNISITMLHALHRRWTALLRSLKPEGWERCYFHPEHDRYVPLWEQTAMYAWHGRHHMEQIRGLRHRMGW